MTDKELDAAGIREPRLRESYHRCRQLNARHGKTYFLATRLLPLHKRPHVHALYGFARHVDDIVDDMSAPRTSEQRAALLGAASEQYLADLDRGFSADPVGRALVHTASTWDIPTEYFEAFLTSMRMDLTVTEYATYEDLMVYVYGSAAVIGLQMLPLLEPRPDATDAAAAAAADLGTAFQLANFIRDIDEDLDRGRVYLPMADLRRHGLSRADLERRVVDTRVRAFLTEQIGRVRRLAERATPGIDLLHPSSRPAIRAAQQLYVGIVDEVEGIDLQVFDHRARTSTRRRLSVAARAYLQARFSRGPTALPGPQSQPDSRSAASRRRCHGPEA